jgi:hypothetical protein
MARIAVPGDNQDQVLLLSRRRCCICFGLHGDLEVEPGQIAHLDHDNTNFDLDNLAFLCLPHHDQYDGKTSQSKGLRESEVKHFRKELYEKVEADSQSETIERARIDVYPVVDFEFMPEGIRHDAPPDYVPKLMLGIRNRGESPIQDVRMQATEYTW